MSDMMRHPSVRARVEAQARKALPEVLRLLPTVDLASMDADHLVLLRDALELMAENLHRAEEGLRPARSLTRTRF